MKKLIVLIAAFAAFACSSPQQEGFQINVQLEGADGNILLQKRGNAQLEAVDTAEIVDGIAILEGVADYPQDYYLSVLGQPNRTLIFVENSNINVTGHVDSLTKIVITGSDAHDKFEELNQSIIKTSEEYMAIYNQIQQLAAAGDTGRVQELVQDANNIVRRTIDLQQEFVRNNPGSYVTPYILGGLQNQVEVEEMDSLLTGLEPKIDTLPLVVAIKEQVDQLMRFAIGEKVPDFTMDDPEGNPITFSDVYSQHELTLLDFWAGWCAPCRQENPNVVSVYNDFKDDGFTVFGVSLDREKDEWLNAIENDHLTWTHVSDLSYWDNAAAELYLVRSIPASFLVDSDGTIVAKDKRGMDLRIAVSRELN